MDISNATAAGPSYGLLDVIFGQVPKEAAKADGQEFGGLMELIKSLNKKEKDEDGNPLDGNRTDQEIASGKSIVDYSAVGIPGLVSNVGLFQIPVMNQSEGEQSLSLDSQSALKQNAVLPGMEKLDLAKVNQILKENSLPPLSGDEIKLLGDVNSKLAQVQGEQPKLIASDKAVNPKAAILAQLALDPKLQKALEKKGIADEGKISSVETQGKAAPESFMNTETYLSMHGNLNPKASAKMVSKEELVDQKIQAPGAPILAAAQEKNSEQAGQSGKEGLSNKAESYVKSLKLEDKKLSSEAAIFADTLGQSVKGSGVAKKDVYLRSAKPEDIKTTLMGEVVSNVNANAVKGGGEMRLVIHPEEMGEVKIKVGSKDGKIDVQISAKNEEVASLIRSGSKDLENSLSGQNLSLARFEVTVSDTAVVSTDTKSSLADQFLSQQQNPSNQGSMQSNSSMANDRGFAQWDNQSQRQSTAENLAEDRPRSSANISSARAKQNYSSRNNSQRLDVVA